VERRDQRPRSLVFLIPPPTQKTLNQRRRIRKAAGELSLIETLAFGEILVMRVWLTSWRVNDKGP
jgi:hypothetical protein